MKKTLAEKNIPLLLNEETPFAIREAFNQLRTNVMYALPSDETCPVFAMTSFSEQFGKSTLLCNLAVSFATLGKKILLIDGDMRAPTVYRYFDLDMQAPGLSEVIAGIESDVIVSDVKPGLDIITSGRIPPNPSELLLSPKLKELLAEWKTHYDLIFFDFPPVGLLTDALALCHEVNGYLFCVRSGIAHAKDLKDCINSMEQVGAKIAGIILNNYNLKGSDSRYSTRYSRYNHYDTNH